MVDDFDYDRLSPEVLDDLELVLNDGTMIAMRLEDTIELEDWAIERVDRTIDAQEPLPAMTLYKRFEGAAKELRAGGVILEKAFLTAADKSQPGKGGANVVELEIAVPAGIKAYRLPHGAYVLPRGLKLQLEPSEDGVIAAQIIEGVKKAPREPKKVETGLMETVIYATEEESHDE